MQTKLLISLYTVRTYFWVTIYYKNHENSKAEKNFTQKKDLKMVQICRKPNLFLPIKCFYHIFAAI